MIPPGGQCHERSCASRVSPARLRGLRVRLAPRPSGRQRRADAAAQESHRQRDADRVRVREQHLDRRARRRRGAAADELSRRNRQPALLARRQDDRVQRRVRRQRGRLHRTRRRRRPQTADVASKPRPRTGMDARRQVDRLLDEPRHVGAERRAAVLDGAGRRGRRAADAAPARVSGKSFRRWHARGVPDEQLVGRGAAELSRRTEPPDLDRRSEDLRSDLAAVDRFEGRRPRLARRHGVLPLGSRRRDERLVVRHESEEARADHEVHRLRRQDRRGGRGRGRVRAGRLRPRA